MKEQPEKPPADKLNEPSSEAYTFLLVVAKPTLDRIARDRNKLEEPLATKIGRPFKTGLTVKKIWGGLRIRERSFSTPFSAALGLAKPPGQQVGMKRFGVQVTSKTKMPRMTGKYRRLGRDKTSCEPTAAPRIEPSRKGATVQSHG